MLNELDREDLPQSDPNDSEGSFASLASDGCERWSEDDSGSDAESWIEFDERDSNSDWASDAESGSSSDSEAGATLSDTYETIDSDEETTVAHNASETKAEPTSCLENNCSEKTNESEQVKYELQFLDPTLILPPESKRVRKPVCRFSFDDLPYTEWAKNQFTLYYSDEESCDRINTE